MKIRTLADILSAGSGRREGDEGCAAGAKWVWVSIEARWLRWCVNSKDELGEGREQDSVLMPAQLSEKQVLQVQKTLTPSSGEGEGEHMNDGKEGELVSLYAASRQT